MAGNKRPIKKQNNNPPATFQQIAELRDSIGKVVNRIEENQKVVSLVFDMLIAKGVTTVEEINNMHSISEKNRYVHHNSMVRLRKDGVSGTDENYLDTLAGIVCEYMNGCKLELADLNYRIFPLPDMLAEQFGMFQGILAHKLALPVVEEPVAVVSQNEAEPVTP